MRNRIMSELSNNKGWIVSELMEGYTVLDLKAVENELIEDVSCDIQSQFSSVQYDLEEIDVESLKEEIRDDYRKEAELYADDVEQYLEYKVEELLKSRVSKAVDAVLR